ncbi:MAG: hypothetical protein BGO67_12205 [Alphaproteobacteria bacterium 41-28]|nr:MAG: hypothetical protein BGO67_12205 [Alphaproteobacteria bacterium 41-28]
MAILSKYLAFLSYVWHTEKSNNSPNCVILGLRSAKIFFENRALLAQGGHVRGRERRYEKG